MTKEEILQIFEKTGAILKGHFKLSSGLHSAEYLQCARVLEHPEYAAKFCAALAKRFEKDKPNIVIAPALGGILVSYEVARSLGAKSMFAERVEGKMALRRGFELSKKDRVLVVEDVITTGLSTQEVINVVKSYGPELIGVGCLIDRSRKKVNFAPRFECLTEIDIPTFKPEDCPLCKDGITVTKPGSRK